MKTLFEYILEAREYFNPNIPFEVIDNVFKTYFAPDDADPDDHELDIYNELKQWLPKNIDSSVLLGILMVYWYSENGMKYHYSKDGVERFVKFITSQPLSRVEKILGTGSEGLVIQIGDGKVMKILFDTDFMSSNKRTLETMKRMIGRNFETLPNVYKVTKNIIIRDDVTPSTPKCREYFQIANTKYGDCPATLERLIAQGELAKAFEVTGRKLKTKPVIKWLQKLKTELQSIGAMPERANNLGDFKPANLGETKDGRVVYFDW